MSDDYVKVEGNSNLVKDKKTGAILNVDMNGLEAAKRRKQLALQQQEDRHALGKLQEENANLRDDIEKLKELVTGVIVNKNTTALEAAKKKKAALNRDRERMEELEQKVDNLTGMLETLLTKLS